MLIQCACRTHIRMDQKDLMVKLKVLNQFLQVKIFKAI